jgi:hypothetical protein
MPGRNFTDEQEAEIGRRYLAGESAKAIGRSLGKNYHASICAALRRQGIEQRPAPERNRLYALNPHVFDAIDNELAAYWLGFLYADGAISRRTLKLVLTHSDQEHLGQFRDFMQSTSPIAVRERPGIDHNAYIEFTDRHLAARVRDLGIVVGRPYPERMIGNVPHDLVHHCIRGFFDGDGSARKNGSVALCGDQAILSWIRQCVADAAGTNPHLTLTKHSKSDIYYLYFSSVRPAQKFASYIYHDATLWLGRKRQVVDSWPQPRGRPLFPNGYKRRTKTTSAQ